ncbi:MAG: hypothetical protein WC473_03520 [Patescibacteria group bacterium]
MNTLLTLCLWHSLYIGILIGSLTLFTWSTIPVIVLVNSIKQRHDHWWSFKVLWLPPQWWMECLHAHDYLWSYLWEKNITKKIKGFPIPTYQEYREENAKAVIKSIEMELGYGVISSLLGAIFVCLMGAIIHGMVAGLALGMASLLLILLLFSWWLILPIIVAYFVSLFSYRKYREYQLTLKKQREDNEKLQTMINELQRDYDEIRDQLQSCPEDQTAYERTDTVKNIPAGQAVATANGAAATADPAPEQPPEQPVDKPEGESKDGPKKTRMTRKAGRSKPKGPDANGFGS